MERLLVFAAHSDDELSMAGTIARAVARGATVGMATLTDGGEGYPSPALRATIKALRRREARACDRVLGVREHFFLDQPDMGLAPSKPLLHALIRIVRRFRPDAVFTHGPMDVHNDHRAAHRVTLDACWHAGQPVAAALGPRWRVPVLYYYKGVGPGMDDLPSVVIDVANFQHKRLEALATQGSQMTLFRTTPAALRRQARALKLQPQPARETFWLAPANRFDQFPAVLPAPTPPGRPRADLGRRAAAPLSPPSRRSARQHQGGRRG